MLALININLYSINIIIIDIIIIFIVIITSHSGVIIISVLFLIIENVVILNTFVK